MSEIQNIIEPIDKEAIISELTKERFFRKTNKGGNEIYIVTAHNAPNTMREIGRLREISFRDSGGGTGKDCDIDEFDTCEENYFSQLLVWNPVDQAITGGYRFLMCDKLPVDKNFQVATPTSELFHYSEKFTKEYLPYTIELGRSFVQPDYQPSKNMSKGIYSLDNLWDGLASLVFIYPQARFFFGKVTMYPQLDRFSRDLILYFIKKHFPDHEGLVKPLPQLNLPILADEKELDAFFTGTSDSENYDLLSKEVRNRGASVPPLVKAYFNLSPTIRSFGTALNPGFGNVEETGLMVTIKDIYPEKLERHTTFDTAEQPLHLNEN